MSPMKQKLLLKVQLGFSNLTSIPKCKWFFFLKQQSILVHEQALALN